MLLRKNWGIFTAVCLTLFFFACVLSCGKNIYIPVHDNLEDIHARYTVLQNENLFWASNTEASILGGLDRNLLPSDLKLQSWIYMFFPAFESYVILFFLKIFLSLAGGIYLGKTFLMDKYGLHSNEVIFCSFLYGILPNEPAFPLCFAGLPLLTALLMNLYRRPRWYYYPAIFMTAFLSDLTYFGMFECGYILVFFFADWLIRKRPKWRLIGALFALSLGLIVVEWRLFYAVFFGEKLIRAGMISNDIPLAAALKQSIRAFIAGHYHSADSHIFVVLPACLIYMIARAKESLRSPLFLLILWIMFNAFCFGFDNYSALMSVKNILPALKGFSISRALWFSGFLWYSAFCIILINLKSRKIKAVLCTLSLIAVCFAPQQYNHILLNARTLAVKSLNKIYTADKIKDTLKNIMGAGLFERVIGGERLSNLLQMKRTVSYNEFYSTELFDVIKRETDYKGEMSIAYGMHPAILYCNNIATLDGYHPYYSQRYKEQFRKLIAPELETDEQHRLYYDNWGGRAYVFSKECSYDSLRTTETNSADLLIDPGIFKEMGGRYVFSRVAVRNYDALGLRHVGIFSGIRYNSPYHIHVYKAGD